MFSCCCAGSRKSTDNHPRHNDDDKTDHISLLADDTDYARDRYGVRQDSTLSKFTLSDFNFSLNTVDEGSCVDVVSGGCITPRI
eukprot:m.1212084 g.1212084  ORF g.1212084 m.1212084 type:complete len:84 (+) comp24597_c0_seq25:355-606(+)